MALLFFKVFSFVIYKLFHAFESCFIAFFLFCLRHLQNMVLSNYVGFNKNKFFSELCSCNILYVLIEPMPEVASISEYAT